MKKRRVKTGDVIFNLGPEEEYKADLYVIKICPQLIKNLTPNVCDNDREGLPNQKRSEWGEPCEELLCNWADVPKPLRKGLSRMLCSFDEEAVKYAIDVCRNYR